MKFSTDLWWMNDFLVVVTLEILYIVVAYVSNTFLHQFLVVGSLINEELIFRLVLVVFELKILLSDF